MLEDQCLTTLLASATCYKDVECYNSETSRPLKECFKGYKYNLAQGLLLADHPISQPSLDICPIWSPIIAATVRILELRPV
jgi:hypothetical protein